MNIEDLKKTSWYPELLHDIENALEKLSGCAPDQLGPQQNELNVITKKKEGWKLSLADPDLPDSIREEIHKDFELATSREQQLKTEMQRYQNRQQYQQKILDPAVVLDCLNRLDEVLAGDNATLGNLELSLHIDSIVCFDDGHVKMKVCRLGALSECVELMSFQGPEDNESEPDNSPQNSQSQSIKPRRRAKLRIDSIGSEAEKLDAAATFTADPHRFSDLSEEWFDEYEFDVPEKLNWSQAHAEEIFLRRQNTKYSYGKLAEEYGVTRPTIRAAIKYYLEIHPEATDNVKLQCGGKRPPKFDLEKIGDEVRDLWVAGWSKLKLAKKFGCSTPTIDKALKWSYSKEGLPLPSNLDRQNESAAKARKLLNEGHSLDEISEKMKISDVTARRYLKMSFEAEGKQMPDLRTRNHSG